MRATGPAEIGSIPGSMSADVVTLAAVAAALIALATALAWTAPSLAFVLVLFCTAPPVVQHATLRLDVGQAWYRPLAHALLVVLSLLAFPRLFLFLLVLIFAKRSGEGPDSDSVPELTASVSLGSVAGPSSSSTFPASPIRGTQTRTALTRATSAASFPWLDAPHHDADGIGQAGGIDQRRLGKAKFRSTGVLLSPLDGVVPSSKNGTPSPSPLRASTPAVLANLDEPPRVPQLASENVVDLAGPRALSEEDASARTAPREASGSVDFHGPSDLTATVSPASLPPTHPATGPHRSTSQHVELTMSPNASAWIEHPVQSVDSVNAQPRPTIMVCTKCRYSVQPGYDDCDSAQQGRGQAAIVDIEDMAKPFVSGRVLYDNVHSLVHDRQLTGQVDVVPVECLSTCYQASCIAVVCPGKFSYQFGNLDPRSTADHIVDFAKQYAASPDGFSKSKTRPSKLRNTILARIPPLPLPASVTPDEPRAQRPSLPLERATPSTEHVRVRQRGVSVSGQQATPAPGLEAELVPPVASDASLGFMEAPTTYEAAVRDLHRLDPTTG